MLPGVKIRDLNKLPDERGFFVELLREDWKEFSEGDVFVQSNMSMSYPGIIRAWHRHVRGQVDYFIVLRGAYKFGIYDDREGSETKGQLDTPVLTSEKLQLLRVPGFYWHGSKVISNEPGLLLYFVTKLYDYKNPDEERRHWNDQTIIDPKTGKPFDWNQPPHR